jgi:hypothetical protein
VVRVLVEVLAPYKGRVYDPCCRSGGMFVSSEKFIEAHSGKLGDISIYGQESNYTTWRLGKMNLAIRGMPPPGNANFAWVQHFIHHLAPTGLAGFVLANRFRTISLRIADESTQTSPGHSRSARVASSAAFARRDGRPGGAPSARRSPRGGVTRPAAISRSSAVVAAVNGARIAMGRPCSVTCSVSPLATRRR